LKNKNKIEKFIELSFAGLEIEVC